MIEAEVQAAFVKYLEELGWVVETQNDDHTDVIAWRGAEVLVAEVKGTTKSPGLDENAAFDVLRDLSQRQMSSCGWWLPAWRPRRTPLPRAPRRPRRCRSAAAAT
jgi:hypothetical protein